VQRAESIKRSYYEALMHYAHLYQPTSVLLNEEKVIFLKG